MMLPPLTHKSSTCAAPPGILVMARPASPNEKSVLPNANKRRFSSNSNGEEFFGFDFTKSNDLTKRLARDERPTSHTRLQWADGKPQDGPVPPMIRPEIYATKLLSPWRFRSRDAADFNAFSARGNSFSY